MRFDPEHFWAPDTCLLVLVREAGMLSTVIPGLGKVWFGEHYIKK